MRPFQWLATVTVCLTLIATGPGEAQLMAQSRDNQPSSALPQSAADSVKWRSIGPANMGGRITAVTVYEADPNIWWAATASGGLLKTVNNGNDFEHQFDDQATVSIGDVQVSQSNPDIVWVGTGESNPRNSVSWGDGVYKSTDGGKTWKNMGLKKTFHTGALAIHPTNPDIVWVGALGRLWGPNEERGLYKTVDGGKTWKKVLYVDDKTGVVDVQLNPKNPDEMLVATYERKRDGFDGNDPQTRFGDGAGIFKSTDGGETFTESTEGLPTCKIGRIGLDYFESDPNFVYAVVESEKIGKEPEDFPYLGLRGSDADAGAQITRVTDDTAAAKAGLKNGDIVVSVNDRVIPTYNAMLEEVYRSQAGDTVKIVVVRDKKLVDLELELGKKPENMRNRSSYFRGTLGGQGANRQDAQGPEGFEYGGIYMSADGGTTWERINSLNPRPMYYSNIQVDPLDRNNLYLCGTSLYKSSDGGKTFTGDGGSDGIHVDHHALWIDKRDPRHMILGNDGGIHVTYDRMEHWDHHNHMAIGQFYHVGIDTRLNYNVYGGLQDNGSWGGPSRSDSGSIINSDWFRVGGGDGFVTLADKDDPNQIYYESQNGGMGSINLETGARGFIRKPRGVRFNWKTPFMLSPHNPRIHLSAGSHVLRSYDRGNKMEKISPDITNSSRGAGSAITESPRKPGVIYVGTTDGAVFMTKDGGNTWQPLFYQPESKEESKEDKEGDKKASDKPKAKSESAGDKPKAKTTEDKQDSPSDLAEMPDPVSGKWTAKMVTDRIPEDRARFNMTLKLQDGKLTGTVDGRTGEQDISDAKFDATTGKISFAVESGRGTREFSGVIKNGEFKGEMSIGGGRLQIPVTAKRDKESVSLRQSKDLLLTPAPLLTGLVGFSNDDPISGTWEGVLENENLPDGRIEFSMELKLKDNKQVRGTISSPQGEIEIYAGVFNPEKKRVILNAESDDLEIEMAGTLEGNQISGTLYVTEPNLEMEFSVKRTKAAKGKAPKADKPMEAKPKVTKPKAGKEKPKAKSDKPMSDKPKADKPKADKPKADKPKADKPKVDKPKPASNQEKDAPKKVVAGKDDPITGTWTGKMVSSRGDRDLTIRLTRKDDKTISGSLDFGQGDSDITGGNYNPETKQLTLMSDSGQFELEATGKMSDSGLAGKLDFGGGRFVMDFNVKRTSMSPDKPEAQEEAGPTFSSEAPTGEGSLAAQLPGPRWVSSLEASRFKDGRCYMSLDGHRSNDDAPYAFVTEDYGQTWKSLTTNLPKSAGSVRVIREDVVNENLLYLGCEFSGWWSIDRGETWTRMKGLPTVAIHEFAIHPKAGEVVAGTHGRSLWIADVTLLRQLSKESLADDVRLYNVKTVYRRGRGTSRGSSGTRRFLGQNPTSGVSIGYSLNQNARSASLKVFDVNGDEIRSFDDLERGKGFHTVDWDLRRSGSQGRFGSSLPTGAYRVELKVDGKVRTTTMRVELDPELSPASRAALETAEENAFDEFLYEMGIDD